MMRGTYKSQDDVKPVQGWTCVAIGVGFVVLVTTGLVLVRMAAG